MDHGYLLTLSESYYGMILDCDVYKYAVVLMHYEKTPQVYLI